MFQLIAATVVLALELIIYQIMKRTITKNEKLFEFKGVSVWINETPTRKIGRVLYYLVLLGTIAWTVLFSGPFNAGLLAVDGYFALPAAVMVISWVLAKRHNQLAETENH